MDISGAQKETVKGIRPSKKKYLGGLIEVDDTYKESPSWATINRKNSDTSEQDRINRAKAREMVRKFDPNEGNINLPNEKPVKGLRSKK